MPARPRPTRILARARAILVASAALVTVLAACASAIAMPISGEQHSGDDYLASLNGTPPPTYELVLTTASVQVFESGTTAEVGVRLASRPDQIVTVTPLPDVPAATTDRQVRAGATSTALEFGPESWNQTRSVTISAIDDDVVEQTPHTAHVTLAIVGPDAQLLASAPVEVRIDDNDRANIIVQDADGVAQAVEGGESNVLDIRLGTRPSADVTVRFEPGSQLVTSVPELTFTPENWNAMQAVRIGALQDIDVEGELVDTLRFTVLSQDVGYASTAATPPAMNVTVHDDDRPAMSVHATEDETRIKEGGRTDSYAVRLDARPTSTVHVSVDAGEDVTASPTRLDFTPTNWNEPQSVNIVAQDDDEDEPRVEKVSIRHTIDGDRLWKVIAPPNIMVGVLDNDDPITDDPFEPGEDGIAVDDEEESGARRAGRELQLIDPSVGGEGGAVAAAAQAGGGVAGRDSGDRITMPDIASSGDANRDATATSGALLGPAGQVRGFSSGERAERPRPEAQPRNLEEWYAHNWKKTVPATALGALGAGGLLFSLMSDGGGLLGRRRFF